MHSATKMIGGHSDLTLGVLVGRAPRGRRRSRTVASTLGQTGNPFESWLALRGLATLSLRMDRACAYGTRAGAPVRVHRQGRPGLLPGPPVAPRLHLLATRLLEGRLGAMVTIDLGNRARAESFIKRPARRFRSPPVWATCRRP